MKVLGLIEKTVTEMAAAKPVLAEHAFAMVHGSIKTIDMAELKLAEIAKQHPKLVPSLAQDAHRLYAKLFTVYGVSQKTADDLVAELIAA